MRVTDLGMWTLLLAAPVVRALRARRSVEMGRHETSAAMQPCRICLLREVALAARYARLGASSPETSLFRWRKSDLPAILGPLFSPQNTVLVTSPASPCVCGHKPCVRATGANSGGHAENGFLPRQGRIFPGRYCIFSSPATPQRRIQHGRPCRMVRWALGHGALLVFDAAYEAFIQAARCRAPSIRWRGRQECAIEIGSFSQKAQALRACAGWVAVP